ncbi:FEC1 [Auxenochlorella protothecoides x Auxenochlorella symbiontica]|uniref:Ferrochelatase n=1 Tax=Auxenochlorella protothecoides TaxID=3075 RepID=A0A1D1ZW11_AUXPR
MRAVSVSALQHVDCPPSTSYRPLARPSLVHRYNVHRPCAAQSWQRTSTSRAVATPDRATEVPPPTLRSPGPARPIPGYDPDTDRVGVLLLNLGGPETLEDVRPFLYNLFADPDIIRLPPAARWLQPAVAWLISTLRAPKSRRGYAAIGGGSPLRAITQEQADALAGALADRAVPARAYVAMRYWAPTTEQAVAALKADRINKLVVLPLYPQFSVSTSGSSLRLLERLLREDAQLAAARHVVIPSWYARPGYVAASCDLIQAELARFPAEADGVEIFFSAHGVPQSYVDEGDPYKEEMEQCVALIMTELAARGVRNTHTLAYQSRVGPVQWLRPYTDDAIRYLGERRVRGLLAVPISFVSEHIETLEEIDMEYRELAEEVGIKSWGRVPALNTNPVFIADLADAVLEALPYAGSVAGSAVGDALVPMGELDALLETYDRDRRQLPAPIGGWVWGWTRSAETWNGRLAMLALLSVLLLELVTGRGAIGTLLALMPR